MTSDERRDLIHVALVVARQALDSLTDNLLKEINQAYSNEALTDCSRLRGELCSYFNGLSLLLEDYCDGIEPVK